jgi:A/G-specific adenine glycosylase
MEYFRDRESMPIIFLPQKAILQFRKQLLQWYAGHRRNLPWRDTDDPYAIWVSEVMLQQTQVQTVIPYYQRFLDRFPDVKRLAAADLQEVLLMWEGMGYYARARNLHRAAKQVVTEYDGRLPATLKEIRKLPGVGEYIASAVLSIAFEQPHAVVDGNVKRVTARLFEIETPVNSTGAYRRFKAVADGILDCKQPGAFNQAVMELGALVCTPRRPTCRSCPVQAHCAAYRSEQVPAYPIRLKRKPVPEYRIAVGIVFKKDRALIARRKPEGLLGGLWEFPGGKIKTDEDPVMACVREIKEEVNLVIEVERQLTRVRHAYTHFRIVMDVFVCRLVSGRVKLTGPVDYRWVRLGDLEQYPFPGANRKFIPLLLKEYEK